MFTTDKIIIKGQDGKVLKRLKPPKNAGDILYAIGAGTLDDADGCSLMSTDEVEAGIYTFSPAGMCVHPSSLEGIS